MSSLVKDVHFSYVQFAYCYQRWCLNSVGQSLVYHLSDIKGMSLWHDKFDEIGVSVDAAQHAVGMAGSFMLKSSELQQSVFHLNLFFFENFHILLQLFC
jgi:hypothetical protein